MYECESCHKEFKKRLHLLRHVNTVHASRKGQKREAPDATEAKDRDGSSESSSKMKKTGAETAGRPLARAATGDGDRDHRRHFTLVQPADLMVLAPTVMCAVAIPRGWNSRSACGLWGVDPVQLRKARQSSHHTYDTLRKELQEVMEQLPVGPRRDHRLIPKERLYRRG